MGTLVIDEVCCSTPSHAAESTFTNKNVKTRRAERKKAECRQFLLVLDAGKSLLELRPPTYSTNLVIKPCSFLGIFLLSPRESDSNVEPFPPSPPPSLLGLVLVLGLVLNNLRKGSGTGIRFADRALLLMGCMGVLPPPTRGLRSTWAKSPLGLLLLAKEDATSEALLLGEDPHVEPISSEFPVSSPTPVPAAQTGGYWQSSWTFITKVGSS